jgi:hypothetical protein
VALSLVFGFWIASLVWKRFEIPQGVPAIPPISKELAVMISDSMVENWADAVEARSQMAEQVKVFLFYHAELQGRSSEEPGALLNRNAFQVFGQIKTAPRRAITRPTMGVQQHAAFSNSSG